MVVKFKRLRKGFELPKKAFESDACYDVVAHEIDFDPQTSTLVCYLGFCTEIPLGYKGVIVPRSGITKTPLVMQNSPGQVDASYRGEWMVKFKSTGCHLFKNPLKVGDRVAQIYFERVEQSEFLLVDDLSTTDRGEGGFGSTGK
jgi:dUTP pyrophosphatase